MLLVDQRMVAGNSEDASYLSAISRQPDRRVYLTTDLVEVDDPETHQHDLYSVNDAAAASGGTNVWLTSVVDRIKFLWPSAPPLLYWDQMNRVIFLEINTTWNILVSNLTFKDDFCTSRNSKVCANQTFGFCWCTYYLELRLNELVEMFIIDTGRMLGYESHSMHLSGHKLALISAQAVKLFIFVYS